MAPICYVFCRFEILTWNRWRWPFFTWDCYTFKKKQEKMKNYQRCMYINWRQNCNYRNFTLGQANLIDEVLCYKRKKFFFLLRYPKSRFFCWDKLFLYFLCNSNIYVLICSLWVNWSNLLDKIYQKNQIFKSKEKKFFWQWI